MSDLYIASSWRNSYYPEVVEFAKRYVSVYDFRNPPGNKGFSWAEIDPNWKNWTLEQYQQILDEHPRAQEAFNVDMSALKSAKATLLVGPCGRSAHLELGYAVGAGQHTAVYLPEMQEPELMYGMVGKILKNKLELEAWLLSIKLICQGCTQLALGGHCMLVPAIPAAVEWQAFDDGGLPPVIL